MIPYLVKRAYCLALFHLKHRGVRVGHGCYIHPSVSVGKNVFIGANSSLYKANIGSHTYCSIGCSLANIEIGSFCSIGGWCKTGLGGHPLSAIATSPIFYSNRGNLPDLWAEETCYEDEFKPIVIENNVLISANVTILDGVTIHEGAVCAAGAVVTSDVPAYSVVGGVPAKVLHFRFERDVIDRLVELRLFDREEDWLKSHMVGLVTPEQLLDTGLFDRIES